MRKDDRNFSHAFKEDLEDSIDSRKQAVEAVIALAEKNSFNRHKVRIIIEELRFLADDLHFNEIFLKPDA